MTMLENLNFSDWPFHTTADVDFASVWAGRKKTLTQLTQLLDGFRLRSNSGLHILWANFGMGKTHTLYHLRYMCQNSDETLKIIPIYAVMPMRSTGFLELYREIVQGMPIDFLKKQLNILGSTWNGPVAFHPMFDKAPGVVKALLSINQQDISTSIIAKQWLEAQRGLSQHDLRQIEITSAIRTPEDALKALTALTKLLCYHPEPRKSNRVLVMIDEYQRIGELSARLRNENNASLHTYFNSQPGIQLMLSFSFGNQDNLRYLVSPELLSRSDPDSILIDVMSHQEAIEFYRDLLSQFRIEKDDRWSFPLTSESVDMTIRAISSRKTLTPRRLMGYFDHVILRCYQKYGAPPPEGYSPEAVSIFLNDPSLGELDADTPN